MAGLVEVPPYALCLAADRMAIRWRSADEFPCLEIWPEAQPEPMRRICGQDRGEGWREVVLAGLPPGARYRYRLVGHQDARSFGMPISDRNASFRLAVFGDPQSHVHYPAAAAAMARFRPDLAVGLGDYVGASADDGYARFLRLSEPLLASTPLLPVPGNHDYRLHSNPFPTDNDRNVFDRCLGAGTEAGIALAWGGLLLVGLDYPDRGAWSPDGAQATWLRARLSYARDAGLRALVFQHCPCFTSTRIDWAVDATVLPSLLAEFPDVVLADFAGHIHTYEHSRFPDCRGVHFVTTGGAGELYDFPVDVCPNPYQLAAFDQLHVCLLTVHGHRARLRAMGLDGQELFQWFLGGEGEA